MEKLRVIHNHLKLHLLPLVCFIVIHSVSGHSQARATVHKSRDEYSGVAVDHPGTCSYTGNEAFHLLSNLHVCLRAVVILPTSHTIP